MAVICKVVWLKQMDGIQFPRVQILPGALKYNVTACLSVVPVRRAVFQSVAYSGESIACRVSR